CTGSARRRPISGVMARPGCGSGRWGVTSPMTACSSRRRSRPRALSPTPPDPGAGWAVAPAGDRAPGRKMDSVSAITAIPAAGQEVDARFEALLLDFLAYLEFERGLSRN